MSVKSYDEMKNRIREYRKNASQSQKGNPKGDDVTDIKDPDEKGKAPDPKKGDGDDSKKVGIPSAQPDNTKENDSSIPAKGEAADRGGVGEAVPSVSKTVNLGAESVSDKVARANAKLKEMREGKKASTPAAKGEPAANKDATTSPENIAADIEATPEFLCKLANALLSTEKGVRICDEYLAELRGKQAAAELISQARLANDHFLKQAAAEREAYEAQAEAEAQWKAAYDALPQAEKDKLQKFASCHNPELDKIADPLMKAAYMQGAADAAEMDDAAAAGGDPALAGASGEPSPEQVAAILEELVASGQITPEEAQAILAQLSGGGDPAAAGAGGDPAAEAAAAGAMPEEMKAASVLRNELIKD